MVIVSLRELIVYGNARTVLHCVMFAVSRGSLVSLYIGLVKVVHQCKFFAQASESSLQKKKPKDISLGIQRYALQFLKSSGSAMTAQAEAPATPERHWESSSTLEPFWEDQFPEVQPRTLSGSRPYFSLHYTL